MFKMETAQTRRRSLDQGMWVFSIDLMDTYFHKQLAIILRRIYIVIHQYLDDWLNKQWSRERSIQDRHETLALCQQMDCPSIGANQD